MTSCTDPAGGPEPGPGLADPARVMRLLPPGRIGVTRPDGFQPAPEKFPDALIAHHPEAKYFST